MSQFNAPTYQVAKSTGVCAQTGRRLEPGETYFATLVDVPEHQIERDDQGKPKDAADLGLRRVDVSQQSWEQGFRPEHLFSHWKTTVARAEQKKKMLVDDAVLMSLLERLADAQRPERLSFRYVLALILIRKKLLRFDKDEVRWVKDNESPNRQVKQKWWVLTPKVDITKGQFGKWDENRTIEVLDPGLNASQIQQVTDQMGEIFDAEV